jgi:hypothetical protein
MRFHKSKKISGAEAERIIETSSSSLNGHVVISHNDDWYDVRLMTNAELQDFVAGLVQAEESAIRSGLITPH